MGIEFMDGMMWLTIAGLLFTLLGAAFVMVRKVARLETEIENGVLSRLHIIDGTLQSQGIQIAEMHGWMRAMSYSEPERDLKG